MKRRHFLQKAVATSTAFSLAPALQSIGSDNANQNKLLSAYYFRAHMYTLVPRHVREDMNWMAGIGTNAICVAVLEQDLFAAVENLKIITEEANRAGMQVFAVPARWGGIVAGAPKVPSLFSVQNPQTWMMKEDQSFIKSSVSGVISSIHYPETEAFFKESIDKLMGLAPIKGIIWDEPKNLMRDFSPKAVEKLGPKAPWPKHLEAIAGFFSRINAHIKSNYPQVSTHLFTYANVNTDVLEQMALIEHLDYFGCDGRPWRETDGGVLESKGKVLPEKGGQFIEMARKNGKKPLFLIENHSMPASNIALMDKRLPEILAMDVEHLIYYYYPRNIEDPDKNMRVLAKHLKNFR